MNCGLIGSRNSLTRDQAIRARSQPEQKRAAPLRKSVVDAKAPIELRIVDESLPANRRARLFEVDAHRRSADPGRGTDRRLAFCEALGVVQRRRSGSWMEQGPTTTSRRSSWPRSGCGLICSSPPRDGLRSPGPFSGSSSNRMAGRDQGLQGLDAEIVGLETSCWMSSRGRSSVTCRSRPLGQRDSLPKPADFSRQLACSSRIARNGRFHAAGPILAKPPCVLLGALPSVRSPPPRSKGMSGSGNPAGGCCPRCGQRPRPLGCERRRDLGTAPELLWDGTLESLTERYFAVRRAPIELYASGAERRALQHSDARLDLKRPR